MGTESKWAGETITDLRLNEMTHLVGTTTERDASVAWPVDMLWYDTVLKSFFFNDGTEAVPVVKALGGGAQSLQQLPAVGQNNALTHVQRKQNSGLFFSDGTNWFRAEGPGTAAGLKADLASTPQQSDAMSTAANWLEQNPTNRMDVDARTAGKLDGTFATDNNINSAVSSDPFGAVINDTNWAFRFKIEFFVTGGTSLNSNNCWFGFSTVDSATDDDGTHDFIGMVFYRNSTNAARINVVEQAAGTLVASTIGTTWRGVSDLTTRWIEVIRNSATLVTMNTYSLAGFNEKDILTTTTVVTTAGVDNLRFWGVWNETGIGSAAGTLDFHVDDLEMWDGFSEIA